MVYLAGDPKGQPGRFGTLERALGRLSDQVGHRDQGFGSAVR
jgi:hypothetical protein